MSAVLDDLKESLLEELREIEDVIITDDHLYAVGRAFDNAVKKL